MNMMVIGLETKNMAKVSIHIQMEINMTASGRMELNVVGVFMDILMEIGTRETGLKIKNMEKVLIIIEMEPNMKVNIKQI